MKLTNLDVFIRFDDQLCHCIKTFNAYRISVLKQRIMDHMSGGEYYEKGDIGSRLLLVSHSF